MGEKIENPKHPRDPRSNIVKLDSYDPNQYTLRYVSPTLLTDEALTPNHEPMLTQRCIGLYLRPRIRELDEVPYAPTTDELPDAVIDTMVNKDKAYWVDKPGANAYVLHDACVKYRMTTEKVLPAPQTVFPRSYQYDLDCVRHRDRLACHGLTDGKDKEYHAVCRNCRNLKVPALTPFQLAWIPDSGQKRWRYYPDLTAKMTDEEIRQQMGEVGRPFRSEACNWYNKNYPPTKYETIIRKFLR